MISVLRGVARAMCMDRIIWWLLGASFIVWPFWGFEVGHVGTFGISPTILLGSLAMVLWVLHTSVGNGGFELHRAAGWTVVLMLCATLAAFSIVRDGASSIDKPVRTLAHLAFLIGMMVVWASMKRPPHALLQLFRTWIWLAFALCLFGVYQIFARLYHLPFAWLELTNVTLLQWYRGDETQQLSLRFGNYFRATSVFSEPSTLGLFCAQAILMLGTATAAHHGDVYVRSGFMRAVIGITLMVTLFLTYSMGALLTASTLFVMMTLSLERARRLIVLRNALAGIAIFVVVDLSLLQPIFGLSITQLTAARVQGIIAARSSGDYRDYVVGDSFATRLRSLREGERIWEQYPIIGAGLGRYAELSTYTAYNDTLYFRVLAELGLLGLIAVVGFLWSVSVHLFRATRRLAIGSDEWIVVRTMAYTVVIQFVIGWASDLLHAELFWIEMGMALLALKAVAGDRRAIVRIT